MQPSSPGAGSTDVKKVMISSTVLDLPDHRTQVRDACLRQGMSPLMMEYLPASDAEAIAESLRMVNEADLYLGIFAYRYGYVSKGRDISITEMEYNRAVERGIPRLLFLMHKGHPLKAADVEPGEGAVKLEALKARLKTERVMNSFTSPAELRAQVIDSLSHYRQPDLTAFHYVSDIPAPPEAYIAHPYTLLQTHSLIGRQDELNLLTDWVAKPGSAVYSARLLNIVAIGGMGKSALTWKWFNDIAPHEMRPLAGRLWWSFYESDASFENFVSRALAYVSKQPREDIQQLPPPPPARGRGAVPPPPRRRAILARAGGPGTHPGGLRAHGRGPPGRRRSRPAHGQRGGRGVRTASERRAVLYRATPPAQDGRSPHRCFFAQTGHHLLLTHPGQHAPLPGRLTNGDRRPTPRL